MSEMIEWDEIEQIDILETEEECYDIILMEKDVYLDEPNFLAEGIVVHNSKMDERYCLRKRGLEEYTIHPLLVPVLGSTYGVMLYQEQVGKILNLVGDIPLVHCESIRKAISKKKIAVFGKYKQMFIENGQRKLGVDRKYMEELWDTVESFAGYGFNKSVTKNTLVRCPEGVKEISSFKPGEKVYCIDENGDTVLTDVIAVHDHGVLEAFEVTFDDGYTVMCSINHKFLTEHGQMSLKDILHTNSLVLSSDVEQGSLYAESTNINNQMWADGSWPQSESRSSKNLCILPREEILDGRMESSLRFGASHKGFDVETPIEMPGLSEIGLENRRWQRNRLSYCPMWSQVSTAFGMGQAPENLFRLLKDKERKHQSKEHQNKPIAGTSKSGLNSCQKNICETGNTSGESRPITEMARTKSRKICQVSGSNASFAETFQNGNLASQTIELEIGKNSLRKTKKTSGLCEGQNLDRSRWLLSLFRIPIQTFEKISTSESPTPRSDVEQRNVATEERYVDPCGDGLFCDKYGSNENRLVANLSGHAPITDTGRLVSRKIVRVVPVGKREMCDLEVTCSTHNFLLATGIITSNSHAYAYSYISARHLWLKSHYPLEFYAATLVCNKEYDEIKGIKKDAEDHGIVVKPVSINKSKVKFEIIDEQVYYGFSNLKTIGPPIAEKIVQGQPYASFVDFLDRFGTDAKVLKALVSIGVFEEQYDRLTLYKYYEYYKKFVEGRRTSEKGNAKTVAGHHEKLTTMLVEHCPDLEIRVQANSFTPEAYKVWDDHLTAIELTEEYKAKGQVRQRTISLASALDKLRRAHERCVDRFQERRETTGLIPLQQFDPGTVTIDPKIEVILTSEMRVAEREYYGFQWVHQIEESPDCDGLTIEKFLNQVDTERIAVGCVEVMILEVNKKMFKSGTGHAFDAKVEDANGKQAFVRFWPDDYERWKPELKKGGIVKMRVKPPFGGFQTLSFESPPKHKRRELPEKEYDYRLVVMRPKEQPEVEDLTKLLLQ